MNASTLGTPAGNGHPLSKQQIYDLITKKVPYKEICSQTGLSKGRISQIKDEYDRIKEAGIGGFFYFEYLDHASAESSQGAATKDFPEAPVLACVGQLVKESEEAIYVRQFWSKTLDKTFSYKIIVKSTITKKTALTSQ